MRDIVEGVNGVVWQAAMKKYKVQIGDVWIVPNNKFILATARAMGLITGFSIRGVKSISDIN